jgi:hypothetical protein
VVLRLAAADALGGGCSSELRNDRRFENARPPERRRPEGVARPLCAFLKAFRLRPFIRGEAKESYRKRTAFRASISASFLRAERQG